MAAQETDADGTVTGINVTPMVDIMLVLLIVFMVTAKFVDEQAVKVHLPRAATAEAAATPALTVKVDASGAIELQDLSVDANGLAANLAREAKQNPGVRVTLAADGDLPYRTVVEILDLIKQAGVVRVGLAAEK